jgi:cystathionine beta-lyase/cystathionine gamma-synthase
VGVASNAPSWDAATRAVTSGRTRTGASLAPSLTPSTVWTSDGLDAARKKATGSRREEFYARYSNPTVREFEDAVAELEGAEAALAFGSGMGALASVVLGLCRAGDHVVAAQQLYAGTTALLQGPCRRFGIETTFVDALEPGALRRAVRPGSTMLVIAETPSNPRLDVVDFAELRDLGGPITMVDSTFATPMLQQPLAHGVDIVMHSATKGIAGHNDATLGVIAGAADLLGELWGYATLHGAVASPFDALNALRGIRTLPVRVRHQCASARFLAESLDGHPALANVFHPALPSHRSHDIAASQMSDFGTMLSIEVAGEVTAARSLLDQLRLVRVATSLGGPETLICHPATSTHVSLDADAQEAIGVTAGLLRLSIGLEDPGDLLADLVQALDGVS